MKTKQIQWQSNVNWTLWFDKSKTFRFKNPPEANLKLQLKKFKLPQLLPLLLTLGNQRQKQQKSTLDQISKDSKFKLRGVQKQSFIKEAQAYSNQHNKNSKT